MVFPILAAPLTSSLKLEFGVVVPIPTLPDEFTTIRSVGEDAPSAVVAKTNSPGRSVPSEGMPFTLPKIEAPTAKISLPSAPLNCIFPKTSLSATDVFEPTDVPLVFTNPKVGE